MRFPKKILGKVESLISDVKHLWSLVWLLAAVALVIASCAGSFFVPTKLLGVIVAALGCFAAGWLFASALSKFGRTQAKAAEAGHPLKAEMKRKDDEISTLENAVHDLKADKALLERQKIDVNAAKHVFKLGLMDAQMSVTDVDAGRWVNDFEESGLFSPAKRSQYIGVLRRSFKATYGVDLAKLHVREENDRLLVAGIAAESLGFKDVKNEWLVRQIQTYSLKEVSVPSGGDTPEESPATGFKHLKDYYEIDRKASFSGTFDRNATAEFCERQEVSLTNRLNNGIGEEFNHINAYIGDMAKGVIRILLSPVGKRVDFVETPAAQIAQEKGWLLLEDFASSYNRAIE